MPQWRVMRASAHILVIFVMALPEDASRAMGIVAGADGYFTVQIDFLTLIVRMRSLLRQQRTGRWWTPTCYHAISKSRCIGLSPMPMSAGMNMPRSNICCSH
jgi:DNA-binding response OmpR family regulator